MRTGMSRWLPMWRHAARAAWYVIVLTSKRSYSCWLYRGGVRSKPSTDRTRIHVTCKFGVCIILKRLAFSRQILSQQVEKIRQTDLKSEIWFLKCSVNFILNFSTKFRERRLAWLDVQNASFFSFFFFSWCTQKLARQWTCFEKASSFKIAY